MVSVHFHDGVVPVMLSMLKSALHRESGSLDKLQLQKEKTHKTVSGKIRTQTHTHTQQCQL